MESGLKEQILDLYPSYAAARECTELGIDKSPIKIRLTRIELSSGEIEVLATTLTDPKVHPYDLFARLYHQRWFVEEDYKCLKLPLEIENFTGKTVHSVYQDCYPQILAKNITSILSFDARTRVKRDHIKQKYAHQINFAYALSKTKEVMVRLFRSTKSDFVKYLTTLGHLFSKVTEPVRPGRKFPRNHRIYKRVYHSNRKCIA